MTSETVTTAPSGCDQPGHRLRTRAGVRSRRAAVWVLGVGVAATMLGAVIAVFRGDGSSINAFLFLDLGLSHDAAASIERSAVAAVALAAAIGVIWPRWFLLVPVAVYLLIEAWAGYHVRGYAFSELTPAAHALRYLAPLALVMLAGSTAAEAESADAAVADQATASAAWRSSAFLVAAAWLLRLGLAAVFLTHGYEAWQLHPEFIDLVITTGQKLLGMRIEESAASTALRAIGALDMAVAVLLLIRPWRAVLIWMMVWGLVTAASRMTSYGWGAHTDVLMRSTHFVAPLTLLLISPAKKIDEED